MAITQWINLQIKVSNGGVARAGFGIPLILSHRAQSHAGWAPGFVHTYKSIADVASDGFSTDSPEYLAANALFAQSPHPTTVLIGRCPSAVTMVWVVQISQVIDSTAYQLQIDGEGVTSTLVTFTSGVGTTNDLIVAGLVTQLNAVVGKNYTAAATGTVGSEVVTITASATGNWFSVEQKDPGYALLNVKQTTADPGIAANLTSIQNENNTYYAIVSLYNSNAYVEAVAAFAETNSKEYVVDVNDTDAISTALGNGDTGDALKGHNYTHTLCNWHHSPKEMLSAAGLGRVLPLNPGLWVWAFKTLVGPTANVFTSTQRQHLIDRRMGSYTFEADRNITWDGLVGSTIYNYIDVAVSLDWFADDVVKSIAGVLFGNDIVEMTNEGIAKVENGVRGSLERATSDEHKILDPGDPTDINNPPPTVSFPRVEDIDPSVRALRQLPDGVIVARGQGAIQNVGIIATISM